MIELFKKRSVVKEFTKDFTDDEEGTYDVIVTCKESGDFYVANLHPAYGPPNGCMENFEKGICIKAIGHPTMYLNGNTRQFSTNPEVCRSEFICDPTAQSMGRVHNPVLQNKIESIYKFDPRRVER